MRTEKLSKKSIGYNFLNNHPRTERLLELDNDKVIVSKNDWEQVIGFFQKFPGYLDFLK